MVVPYTRWYFVALFLLIQLPLNANTYSYIKDVDTSLLHAEIVSSNISVTLNGIRASEISVGGSVDVQVIFSNPLSISDIQTLDDLISAHTHTWELGYNYPY